MNKRTLFRIIHIAVPRKDLVEEFYFRHVTAVLPSGLRRSRKNKKLKMLQIFWTMPEVSRRIGCQDFDNFLLVKVLGKSKNRFGLIPRKYKGCDYE